MLIKILIGFAVVVAIFILIVASRPSTFRVTRSTTISAPSFTVFEHVNDLHKWQAWSPWAKLDPNCKTTFSGPEFGTGASFTWAGNKEIGEGTMTITESRPADLVRFRLEFRKPFEGVNDAEFTLKPEGQQTVVNWSMSGTNNFIFKAVGLFMDCDKMVGGQFEKGLADLKAIAETSASKGASASN